MPVWQVRVGDTDIALRDLPVGLLERVKPAWSALVAAPLVDLDAAEALLRAAHLHAGVAVPRNMSTRALLAAYTTTEDDLPDVWMDGAPEDAQRHTDPWIALLCRPPYSYTPKQVREEFTVRDFLLLREAAESRDV